MDGLTERMPQGFSVAATELVEAACRARVGDRKAAEAHISQALALLGGRARAAHVSLDLQRSPLSSSKGGLTSWQMRRVAAHVDAHMTRRIPVAELASVVRLSTSHFCRAFKSTIGVTAHAWLTSRRVAFAQSLMLTTDATLSEIALSCGMCDQSHFTRSFRRTLGETPRSWRRSRRSTVEDLAAESVHRDARTDVAPGGLASRVDLQRGCLEPT